jgi:hypothetical protein
MNSPELPFVLRGGNTEQAAIENRINAIERIKFLSGVDMRTKSPDYLRAFDLEMYVKFYRDINQGDMRINEKWCQRAATIIKEMEEAPVEVDSNEYHKNLEEFNARRNVEIGRGDVGEAKQVEDRVCSQDPPKSN